MEHVPSTQRPDTGNEMDQTVNEGVGERIMFCAPFTREGQMANEVRRRPTEEAMWNERLRPVLSEQTEPTPRQTTRVFEQLRGCPIGGLMSAIYANIYCAHDERALKRWRLTEEAMWNERLRPVLNEQTGPTPRQTTNERAWPTPKLHHFPMRTRKLVSYHNWWNGGDQDRARVERHEGEAKAQEK
jgi:hypothetical protein